MTGSVFRDVLGSTVRTDVLLAVVEGPRSTEELKAAVDASESAVYNALDDLNRYGLVQSVDGGWGPTGSGRLVADLLDQQENLCRLLDDDYWQHHDVGVLPRRFRLRLTELADADVFRAPNTEPHAVVEEVCARIEADSPDVDVITPIYQPEYDSVMPDSASARLLIDTGVIEGTIDAMNDIDENDTYDETPVRICDVDIALSVTPNHLMLSLPTVDGQYDSRTEVFATDDRALAWGRDLFEFYWRRGRPAKQFLTEQFG